MENLKAKRKGLRISFKTCANRIETEILKDTPELKELTVLQIQLKDKFSRLEEVQESISNLILQGENAEKEFEKDFCEAEEYRDKHLRLSRLIEQLLLKITLPQDSSEKRNFKLPKLELRKYSGEPKDFLAFWNQFQKIHDDSSIPNGDKFQYLLQAMVPNSRAAKLVESFPGTAVNYPKVIEQLKERFGREDLLVQVYVRDLLSMVMKNAVTGRSKTDLSSLYYDLVTKLQALESLGKTQEKYGDFLSPLVESCLPESVLISWERNRSFNDTSDRTLEGLMTFLQLEVKGQEMVDWLVLDLEQTSCERNMIPFLKTGKNVHPLPQRL